MNASLLAPSRIEFSPCDGYGDVGRTASLYNERGENIAHGNGSDDYDAVIDALMGAGCSFDFAFNNVSFVLAAPIIVRN